MKIFLPYLSNNESINTQWDYFSPIQPVINETIDTSPHPPIIDDDDVGVSRNSQSILIEFGFVS